MKFGKILDTTKFFTQYCQDNEKNYLTVMAKQRKFSLVCPCDKKSEMEYVLDVEEKAGKHLHQKQCLKCHEHKQDTRWLDITLNGWKEVDRVALQASK